MDPVLLHAMAQHGGVFAAADAVATGMDRTDIRPLVASGEWRRVRYGIYTTGATWRQHEVAGTRHDLECAAVVRRLGRDSSVVSHTSAARLHGLIVPDTASDDVWLTDPEQFRTGRGYRIREAPLPPSDVVAHGPLKVTSLARTLADVGREWDITDTVVAADDALADGRVTTASLTTAALAQTHWIGAGRAARALGLARVGAHSPHETRTRLGCVGAGLPEPMLQVAVFVGSRLVAVLDMLWPDYGVFGLCDGKVKFTDPWNGRTPAEVAWREKSQHDELLDLGLTGVHVKPIDLRVGWNLKVDRVRRLMAAATPGAPRAYRTQLWRGGLRPSTPSAQDAG